MSRDILRNGCQWSILAVLESENIEVSLSFSKPVQIKKEMGKSYQVNTNSNDKKWLMQVDAEIFFPFLLISFSMLTKYQATYFIVWHLNVSLLYLDSK